MRQDTSAGRPAVGATGVNPRRVCFLPSGHIGECTDLSLEKSNELAQKIMRKVDELLPTVDKQVSFP
jgi:hypothetical protein